MSYDNIRQQDREVYDAMMRELKKMRQELLVSIVGRQVTLH